jgi:cell division protein FtsI/penicillin-binding protein 2
MGTGIGLGSPGVVPVATSDFIFPAILEEYGFTGAVVLCGTLAILSIRGLTISLHAPNQYQRFLAAGLTTYLATQSILIMGGTVRMLPLTGVTLPFMSYGGSSLVTSFISGFVLLMISNQAEDHPAEIERAKPFQLIGSIFIVAFTLITLFAGWWGLVRSNALLQRSDNPRRAISDRYVSRGKIVDQNNLPLTAETGVKGEYVNVITYTPLSATIGYSNPNYGQTGIESAMDSYLRGVSPGSETKVFLNRLLFSQYPVGANLRLSLDLALQQKADSLLSNFIGSVVVMNPNSGETLVISTSPTFNANELESKWESWMADTNAPLLNRVTMGQYPPGATLGGMVLASYLSTNDLSTSIPDQEWSRDFTDEDFCAILPGNTVTWGKLVSSGCISPLMQISQSMQTQEIVDLMIAAGLNSTPKLPLEISPSQFPEVIADLKSLYTGDADLLVSPIQVAVMASVLSNGGYKVEPRLLTGYQPQKGNWQLFPDQLNQTLIRDLNTSDAASKLTLDTGTGWEISAYAQHAQAAVSWYVTGTPADWTGAPLVMVVALENGTAAQARTIGRQLFLYSFNQSNE